MIILTVVIIALREGFVKNLFEKKNGFFRKRRTPGLPAKRGAVFCPYFSHCYPETPDPRSIRKKESFFGKNRIENPALSDRIGKAAGFTSPAQPAARADAWKRQV